MNRKRNLLSSVGLALVGTLLLVVYVRTAEGKATADQRTVPVLVVQDQVARGATAGDLRSSVAVRRLPADARAHGALGAVSELAGRVPSADLYPGEQVIAERLSEPDEVGASLPDGTTAVSLSLEPQRAVAGQLQSGAKVDVLASFDDPKSTETILRDALVQSVASTDPPDDGARNVKANVLVTLAVSPEDAEKVVNAADHGRVWLTGTSHLALATEPVK